MLIFNILDLFHNFIQQSYNKYLKKNHYTKKKNRINDI